MACRGTALLYLLLLYLKTLLSCSDYIASNKMVTSECSNGKDVEGSGCGQFNVLSRHLPGGTAENYKILVRIGGLQAKI
jgi:hypothetical protein